MTSSDSRRNNGDHLEEEEEEEVEEYEEIEEYEEVEVEEDPEEEEFEEVEEVVEEEEDPEEEEVEEEVEEVEEAEVEEEYEEVVEEEEEVEYEEVEEEIEVTDEEEGEEEEATMAEAEGDDNVAKSDSPVAVVADKACDDGIQKVESKGDEVCSRPGLSSAVRSEASIEHDICAIETFCSGGERSSSEGQNGEGKGISCVDFGTKFPEFLEHNAAPPDNGSDAAKDKQGHVEETILVSASDAMADQLGTVETTDVKESKLLSEEGGLHSPSIQDMDKKNSRSCVSRVRSRSLFPKAECENGNKRPAIICEYYAKGWCIKGGSCRFLHKRDKVVEDTLLTKSELQLDKGSGDDADAPELHDYNQPGSLVRNSEHFLPNPTAGKDIQKEHGEVLKFRQCEEKDKSSLHQTAVSSCLVSADSPNSSSCKDGIRSMFNHREVEANIFCDNHSSDTHGLSINFFPRSGSFREVGLASGSDSILRLVEESAAMRRRYSLDFQSSVPSYQLSSWKSTSLLHNSPLLPGYESAKFSDASYAHDQLKSYMYKPIFTPYNWEPSVPFRSAYIVPPVNRSSDVQYDPFRDSIEQPDVGRASFRHSSYSQTQDVQSISGHNSLELHKRLESASWDKNYSGHDKVVPVAEAESAATSASDAQNKNLTEEENPMVSGSVKDILKASRSINDGNSKLHSDLLRHGEMKVEKGRQPNELDDEESKAIRYFCAALIEFVKELMKPIWHEGRLSKDVYKVIVQKAEDKILSTLQPNQVPSSSESIKQYLSSSQPKILKLIQAYVDKYGKF